MPAFGKQARGAYFLLNLTAARTIVSCDLSMLPPPHTFDAIGSVFIDNRQGTGEIFVYFPDTQAISEIAAGTQSWIIGVTGSKRFGISAPFLVGSGLEIQVAIQVVNFLVPPNSANLVTVSGAVTVVNPGPAPIAATDFTGAAIPATTNTVLLAANPLRQFMRFGAPPVSDMWVNFTGGAASVGGPGCFLMFAGEKYSTAGNAETTGQVSVFLVSAPGVVPVIQG